MQVQAPLLAALLVAPSLTGVSSFQGATPQLKLNWPLDPGGSGPYGNAILADLDADGLDDFVTIRGGMVEALCAPSVYAARLTDIATATDIACLRTGPRTPDSLVVADAGGVRKLTWNRGTLSWESDDLTTDPDWSNARRIAVRPTGKDAPPQIVGLSEDGLSIRVLHWDGAGYVDNEIFWSTIELQELLLYDREGDGTSEIAVMAQEYLAVFEVLESDPGGPETWVSNETYFFPGFTSVDITAGRDNCSPAEWIAWVSSGPALATQWMATISASGSSAPINLQGNRQIVALASGDWNRDCDTDILLSWQETEQVPVLQNLGSAAPVPFSIRPEEGAVLYLDAGDSSLAATTNQAAPVSGDLDGDGDADICFPVQSQAALYVALNPSVDHDAMKPQIRPRVSDVVGGLRGTGTLAPKELDPPDETVLEADEVRLRARVDSEGSQLGEDLLFTLYVDSNEVPSRATHIEVLLWRMPNTSSDTDPLAVAQRLIPLEDSTAYEVELELLDGDVYPMMPIYYWLSRYVEVDERTARVTTVFPSQVHGIQANGSASAQWTWMSRPVLMGTDAFDVERDPSVSSSTTIQAQSTVPELLGRGLAFPCLPALPKNNPPRLP